MRMRRFTMALVLCVSFLSLASKAATAGDADRMAWWRDARFGMFIHWGLYAIPAGNWDGKPVAGIGEWIMDRANVPVEQYEKLATQFNPVEFDAAEWVRIAKNAGMKYIVITSKHHDGFCLFKTEGTQYNVVDGSPYGKDLLKALSAECRKQGVRFCVYYSIMDWHHPAQYRGSEKRYNPTKIHEGRKKEYLDFMKLQLHELLDQYDPGVLWFDGEWPKWYTADDGWEIYEYLRKLRPSLIINNRVGSGRKGMSGMDAGDRKYAGDFGTPEQEIPATGIEGADWESCMTMNDTWGFKKDDHHWKSSEDLIRKLIDIASKGGNFLLNVGPTAAGLIPDASVERLAAVGDWMKVNGESIHGTQASPFAKTPWGRCTRKAIDEQKTRLYLHVFQRPADGKLIVPTTCGRPLSACLLDGGKPLNVAVDGDHAVVTLPAQLPSSVATVVQLDVKKD